eukprot:3579302-Amphidinium_carterae.1
MRSETPLANMASAILASACALASMKGVADLAAFTSGQELARCVLLGVFQNPLQHHCHWAPSAHPTGPFCSRFYALSFPNGLTHHQ